MKVDVSVLTKKDIEGIKRWLKLPDDISTEESYYRILLGSLNVSNLDKNSTCPFDRCKWGCINKSICISLFPRLPKATNISYCPCHFYSLKYVIKRARYFIKKWEEQR